MLNHYCSNGNIKKVHIVKKYKEEPLAQPTKIQIA
jgi:hypothetical protein